VLQHNHCAQYAPSGQGRGKQRRAPGANCYAPLIDTYDVNIMVGEVMKAEYDFSKMKSRKNPYASKLKKQVTIRMGEDVIEYFKAMAEETGIPYQSLINLYLRDCVAKNRKVNINWLKRA